MFNKNHVSFKVGGLHLDKCVKELSSLSCDKEVKIKPVDETTYQVSFNIKKKQTVKALKIITEFMKMRINIENLGVR